MKIESPIIPSEFENRLESRWTLSIPRVSSPFQFITTDTEECRQWKLSKQRSWKVVHDGSCGWYWIIRSMFNLYAIFFCNSFLFLTITNNIFVFFYYLFLHFFLFLQTTIEFKYTLFTSFFFLFHAHNNEKILNSWKKNAKGK